MPLHDTAPTRVRRPGRPPILRSCEICSANFLAAAPLVDRGGGRFCGQPCLAVAKRRGDVRPKPRIDPVVRFWSLVDQDGPLPTSHPEFGNCWPRSGANRRGYSIFNDGIKKATIGTHFAWKIAGGSLLVPGTTVGHTCDNPPCVRNDTVGTYEVDGILYERHGHLWLAGDSQTNTRDRTMKDRNQKQGNPLFRVRGQGHLCAKLTDDDVRLIRALHAGGSLGIEIAQQIGVSPTTVSRVLRGKRWYHVD